MKLRVKLKVFYCMRKTFHLNVDISRYVIFLPCVHEAETSTFHPMKVWVLFLLLFNTLYLLNPNKRLQRFMQQCNLLDGRHETIKN